MHVIAFHLPFDNRPAPSAEHLGFAHMHAGSQKHDIYFYLEKESLQLLRLSKQDMF